MSSHVLIIIRISEYSHEDLYDQCISIIDSILLATYNVLLLFYYEISFPQSTYIFCKLSIMVQVVERKLRKVWTNKGNNKITEPRTILQRESQNS